MVRKKGGDKKWDWWDKGIKKKDVLIERDVGGWREMNKRGGNMGDFLRWMKFFKGFEKKR